MHPPERGFGKPPRTRPDSAPHGQRPLLQGHLKRGADRLAAPSEPPAPEATRAKAKASPKASPKAARTPK